MSTAEGYYIKLYLESQKALDKCKNTRENYKTAIQVFIGVMACLGFMLALIQNTIWWGIFIIACSILFFLYSYDVMV